MKQIVLSAIFFSCSGAMELQIIQNLQRQQEQEKIALSSVEDALAKAVLAHEMRWVPQMYEASGLSCQMSKPFFIVNALSEIKERMENTRCCPGLQDCVEECSQETCCTSLMVCNVMGSTVAFALTLAMGLAALNSECPRKYPERVVDTSCFKAEVFFNDSRGIDWINSCISQSKMNDKPYNYTQMGELQVSNLCFTQGDLKCFQEGLKYNKEIYPALRAQAVWDAWKPFMIAGPMVFGIQLALLVGYKLRRYMRQNARQPFRVAADQPLLIAEDVY